jgi:hypothetical protein
MRTDIKNKDINMNHLERWLGDEKIAMLRDNMRGWYGRPIYLIDVPGHVWVDAQGNFRGHLRGGQFMSAVDTIEEGIKRYLKQFGKGLSEPQYATMNAGFASVSAALERASQGYSQRRPFNKVGPTGVVGVTSSLWRVGPQPAAGSAGAAAPGGTAHTSANTGALAYANPAAGTLHLTGASVSASVINNTLLVYDRLFSVAKTMNSTATEAVTGVPTRYQSTTALNEDYAGDNFLFVEVGGTALAATAHNWTTCLYTDQDGNASATLPSLTGNSGAIVDRLDHPVSQWFAPLASGDTGIQQLDQMQCSAAVASGAINFVIGHPLGWMSFPVINSFMPTNFLYGADDIAPRIFNDACIAFLEPLKPATNTTTYTGKLTAINAAA